MKGWKESDGLHGWKVGHGRMRLWRDGQGLKPARRLGLEIRMGGGLGPEGLVGGKGVARPVGIWLTSDVIYWGVIECWKDF